MNLKNKIYVIRHGQSDNNVLGIESCLYSTQVKFGLTDMGQDQVKKSADEFAGFDVIYSSPYRRTLETSDIMQTTSDVEILIEPRLQEFQLPSRFDQQAYQVAADLIHEKKDGLDINKVAIEDSESFLILFNRVKSALEEIDSKYENKKILLVTHGSPFVALLQVMREDFLGFVELKDIPKNAQVVCLNNLKK